MKEQRKVEENQLAQLPWQINNENFCYDGNSPNNNNNEEKTTLFTA